MARADMGLEPGTEAVEGMRGLRSDVLGAPVIDLPDNPVRNLGSLTCPVGSE